MGALGEMAVNAYLALLGGWRREHLSGALKDELEFIQGKGLPISLSD